MAKLATLEHDEDGTVTRVIYSDLPAKPEPSTSTAKTTSSSHKKRVPSSPHKPFTSNNFHDLTKSASASPEITFPSLKTADKTQRPQTSSGFRALQQIDRENMNTIPGPFAQRRSSDNPASKPTSQTSQPSFRKPSAFIDPGELLTPKSDLWKTSKVDVRKPSWNNPNTSYNRKVTPPAAEYSHLPTSARAAFNSPNHNPSRGETSRAGPSRLNATAITIPTNPPRPFPHKPSSAFMDPDMLARPIVTDLQSINKKPEEALKDFFESALVPETDDETSETVELDENAGVVEGLHVKLMKHQIEGLEFLLDHESLEDTKVKGKGKYGGILADDMGLGKTIQTLALILAHPRQIPADSNGRIRSTPKCSKGTLLVVPLALADQWRREIEEKTTLKAYVHHGPKREKDPVKLAKWDVVITTYDTVSSEWFQTEKGQDEPTIHGRGVFLVNWWRIVLDEAHTIKNRKAKMSQAACALSAKFRWCLTGTPYQNSVDDVYSLVKFLRIPPFAGWEYFRAKISGVAKNGNMSLALGRLRTLLCAIMLRRKKDILKENGVMLPAKEVISEELDFDETERKFYDDLLARGQQVIEELQASKGGLRRNYMCLLTMLLRLRQTTDHVDLLKGRVEAEKDALAESVKPAEPEKVIDKDADDDLVNMMSGLGIEAKCAVCFTIITSGRERCGDCDKSLEIFDAKKVAVGRTSSSKIRRMLEILKTNVDGEPVKTIIFSQFTTMLDVIEPFLRDHNIAHGRYDGKMRKDQRDAMLNAFRTTSMPVLLVSLKSGSVGLNLTSASRVIMLDMWWNPAIEEQAIDRVHRIGQTRRVVVHKLTIKNSVDEQIGRLQAKKREAASGALGDGIIRRKGQTANTLSLEDVLFMFSMPDRENE